MSIYYDKYLEYGFEEYDDYKYDSNDLLNKLARIISSIETQYDKRTIEDIRLIESNLYNDLKNNRFILNNNFIEFIDLDVQVNKLLNTDIIEYDDYEYIFAFLPIDIFKKILLDSNIDDYIEDFEILDVNNVFENSNKLKISNKLIKNKDIQDKIFEIRWTIYPELVSPKELFDSICKNISSSEDIIDIKFKDNIIIHNTYAIGFINIKEFIKDNNILFKEYSKQIYRAVYYLDLIADVSKDIKDEGRNEGTTSVNLGIMNYNILNVYELCSSISTDKSIIFNDIIRYLSMISLAASMKICKYFNKCSSTYNPFLHILIENADIVDNILEHIDEESKKYYHNTSKSIIKSDNKKFCSSLCNTLNMLYNYNSFLYNDVLDAILKSNMRVNCLPCIDLEYANIKDIELIGNIFSSYLCKEIIAHIDTTHLEIDNIYNILKTFNDSLVNHLVFYRTECKECKLNYDNNDNECFSYKIDYNKDNISLKNMLTKSSVEELVTIFKDNPNIYNKVLGSLISSGRSAEIVNYTEEEIKLPTMGVGAYININESPYGRICFSSNFDMNDKMREVFIKLDNEYINDKELVSYINIISKLISIILQESSDYKTACIKICKVLKEIGSFTEFIYENVRNHKEVSIHNICELIANVLPDLEYLYLLNKYDEAELAIKYMKYKNEE